MSRLPRRVQAVGELQGPGEVVLFARISAFAACVPLLVRLPLPVLAAVIGRAPGDGSRSGVDRVDRLPELIGLAHRAFRPVVGSGCLTRGVTLLWFLRRRGVAVELCFGVDPAAEPADGHCWLVRDGEPFLEPADPRARFTETYRLPRPVG
ncbi:MAG TPA: lasso peptide biosynthesis B2 protein [Solirubrobacteraceae bacterium]|nr:lasso peptide biosynthesis B2 protein [Solirubrobacteraceae bacterium]